MNDKNPNMQLIETVVFPISWCKNGNTIIRCKQQLCVIRTADNTFLCYFPHRIY